MTWRLSDPPKGMKGSRLYRFLLREQRRWIEDCEQNGVSYSGERGAAIKQADLDEERRLAVLAGEEDR